MITVRSLIIVSYAITSFSLCKKDKPKHVYTTEECKVKCNGKEGYVMDGMRPLIPIAMPHVWDNGKKSKCDCLINTELRRYLDEKGLDDEKYEWWHRKGSWMGRRWLKQHNIKVEFLKMPSHKKMRKEVEKEFKSQGHGNHGHG